MAKDRFLKDKVIDYLEDQKTFGNTIFFETKLKNKKHTVPQSETKQLSSNSGNLKSLEIETAKFIDPSDIFSEEPEWKRTNTLKELYDKINLCQNCALGATRKNFVFGSGNPNADIMIIGEAPGADEDEQGLPFVGRAGQLLTKIIESINLKREDVFICNILKCRPPGNRVPLPAEVDQCEPYLKKQIELIKPKFILALGLTAVDTLFKKKHKMGEIRGSVMNYHGIKLLVTYHPAALLRNPEWKKAIWEDMKNLKKMYEEYLNRY